MTVLIASIVLLNKIEIKILEPNRGTLKFFTETTSSDLVHCIILTLQEGSYKQAIIHVSINGLLNGNSIENIVSNLQKSNVEKSINYRTDKISISGLVCTTMVSHSLWSRFWFLSGLGNKMTNSLILHDSRYSETLLSSITKTFNDTLNSLKQQRLKYQKAQ